MKIIFLDFDGVMDAEYYSHILYEAGKPIADEHGLLFDPKITDSKSTLWTWWIYSGESDTKTKWLIIVC